MNQSLSKLTLLSLGGILFDLFVLGAYLYTRTSAPISSPWSVLPWWVFLAFGISSATLGYTLRSLPRLAQTGALLLHGITAWFTVLFVYRLGFGFDPFLHQAAEQHLVTHGSISLQTPLYVGQYALVWLLETLSPWSVIQIDQWLVPILSLGLIPLFQHKQRFLALALFLIPVSRFSFTIPFHLACLPLLAILILSDRPLATKRLIFLSLLAVLSLLVHPLVGIPSGLIVIGLLLEKSRWSQLASFIPAIGIPLGLFAAFAVYVGLQHAHLSLPSFESALTSLSILLSPAYPLSLTTPWLSLVYGFLSLWPLVFCLVGLKENLQDPTADKRYRLMIAIGLFSASIVLAACVRLPDIIAHEQFEFPLRLLQLIPLLFLPDIAKILEKLFTPTHRHARYITLGSALCVGGIAAAQWFVSYPQDNPLVHRYTPGASAYEYEALRLIEQATQNQPFLVLSHQMLGAVALQQRGFTETITTCHGEHLRYALPTGGVLYQDFLALLRASDARTTLVRLQTCYGKNTKLFIILPVYLDPEKQIQTKLLPLTSTHTDLGGYLNVYQVRQP